MPTPLSRAYYLKLVEQDYFGGVMAEALDDVVRCFTADAEITIYHGDNQVRRFYGAPAAGQPQLSALWTHIAANYQTHFDQFQHIFDVDHACSACTFIVTLTPKPNSAYRESGTLTLNNSNFFWFRDGKIARMTIYYANPTLGAKLGTTSTAPTAFPKA